MILDFSENFFSLLGQPTDFNIDLDVVSERYQSLQRDLHPDRYVNSSDQERRWSLQATSLINDAYQTLKKPLLRASYLLKLRGIDLGVETDTRMSGAFLMQQMELREQISGIRSSGDSWSAVASLQKEIRGSRQQLQSLFVGALQADDMVEARAKVREWQFIEKLQSELKEIESELDDEHY